MLKRKSQWSDNPSYPRGMNVCTKFHGKPSNSCLDISFKATNVNAMVEQEEKSGDHRGFFLCGPLHRISRESIQRLLRCFSLDQSGGQIDLPNAVITIMEISLYMWT